ncbi:hypothetical protein F4819DRAFT_450979 [Hypoxylon fuscum]|nr:hypothetical protein F4819DRAFT_450979 [Hypoxylon fuscum]
MSPSTLAPLESLPLVVLDRICEYLASCGCKKRSLWAFAMSSRCCFSAAEPHLYSLIKIVVDHPSATFQRELEGWMDILSIGRRFRYVRKIKVERYTPAASIETEEQRYQSCYFDIDPFCQPSRCRGPGTSDVTSLDTWEPISFLISQSSGLVDFVWAYQRRLPRCILSAVHAHGCRLHIHTFKLGSLVQSRDNPHEIDLDDYALATSPCLYSVVAWVYDYDSDGNVDYNQDALLHMVAGAAPRLAHLCVKPSRPGSTMALLQALQTPRPAWSGFFPGTEPTKPTSGSLRSLDIEDNMLRRSGLHYWSQLTDFSRLHSLSIRWVQGNTHATDSLQTLAEFAINKTLQCLQTLVLSLPETSSSQMQSALMLFLGSLNALERLELTGFISPKTFNVALRRHGPTLRILRILPHRTLRRSKLVFSSTMVEHLAELCPILEQVNIRVPRTQGDNREARIYRALSTMPRLQHVSLLLDLMVVLPEEFEERGGNDGGTMDDEDDDDDEGDVLDLSERVVLPPDILRNSLINAAIDPSLARSIFDLLSSHHSMRNLKLQTVQDELGPNQDDLYNIFSWIGGEWVCERDDQDNVSIRDRNSEGKEDLESEIIYTSDKNILETWNDLWPQRTSDWWKDWKSFPLSGLSS